MCEAYRMQMTQKEGYVWFLPGWFKERWFDIDLLRLAFSPLPPHYLFYLFCCFFPRLSPFYVTNIFIKNIQHYITSNLQNKNKAKIICIIALNNMYNSSEQYVCSVDIFEKLCWMRRMKSREKQR